MFETRRADAADETPIAGFYAGSGREFNREGGVVVLAVAKGDDRSILGASWLDDSNDTCVLRKMQVAPAFQGQGVGSALLRSAVEAAGSTEMWCLPWRSLIDFYSRAGFVVVAPASAPTHLSSRLAEYRARNLDIVLMRRDPTT